MSVVRHFIMATAGHVDHGKSSLVRALTGTDPDRLPEEKARGITIELGFAHLDLAAVCDPACTFKIGIVDVPGHEDFVKNMVSGVGAVDLALFVVAADDGWMPQTEEHLQILNYLGVTRAVVALTKCDLAEDLDGSASEIREHLEGTPFENAKIVPTSVISGRGLEELKSTLAEVFENTPEPLDAKKARLNVDRVFSLKGIGTIVTGSLIGGSLEKNQNILVQPGGENGRVRSIQSHNSDVSIAHPGTRTALNIPDLQPRGESGKGIARGDTILGAPLGPATNCLDVMVHRSDRQIGGKLAKALKHGAVVRWHHGSGNSPARIYFSGSEPLERGGEAIAELRFENPVFAVVGERFILRDWAEQMTIGGGIVLDASATAERFRLKSQRSFLESRRSNQLSLEACLLSEVQRDLAVSSPALLLQSIFSGSSIKTAIDSLAGQGKLLRVKDYVLEPDFWRELKRTAAELINAEHKARPELPGLALDTLRAAMAPRVPKPEVMELLEAELCSTDFVRAQTCIASRSHRPNLPPHLKVAGERLRGALSAKPMEPPSRKELAPDPLSQQALRFLIQSGEAIELGPDIVLARNVFDRAVQTVRDFLKQKGQAGASEIRQALNTSRRIAIPLLEKLDEIHITMRVGDQRKLRT